MSGLGPALEPWRAAGEEIALVPTMGALHQGHLDLVTASRRVADRVIATIFVNPLQFNDSADLDRYPRTEAVDCAQLRASGCDALWICAASDLYPNDFATRISVAGVSERWEGAHRARHFDGVATVVAKLFIAVMPDAAIFGEKDWQQLAVIKRMTVDLGLPIAVHGYPTVRENDGLAMSSRNALLSADERRAAPSLHAILQNAANEVRDGKSVSDTISRAVEQLQSEGFGPVEYFAYVDGGSLEPLIEYREGGRLIAAAFLGKTRLIDNVRVVSATG
ncbi:MAG: pantoate--beta-alanine ligase [Pseudomonadota bacterium]|nr:pantoate--beta-alanine ligase [Pseudomonadota bacterium]